MSVALAGNGIHDASTRLVCIENRKCDGSMHIETANKFPFSLMRFLIRLDPMGDDLLFARKKKIESLQFILNEHGNFNRQFGIITLLITM